MSYLALMRGVVYKLFDAATAEAATSDSVALLPRAQLVTWQTSFGTAPDSVSINIQASNDDLNWATVLNTTAVGGTGGNFQTAAKHLRAVIVAIVGGADVTVSVVSKPN